jgi:hypothetical protein
METKTAPARIPASARPGTAYKTAWYLSDRIREAVGLVEAAENEPLTGTLEADETYMGAKQYDKLRKRAKYAKEPVFEIIAQFAVP